MTKIKMIELVRKMIGLAISIVSVVVLRRALDNVDEYIIQNDSIIKNTLINIQNFSPIIIVCSMGVIFGYFLMIYERR